MDSLNIEDIAYLDVDLLLRHRLRRTLSSAFTVVAPLGKPVGAVASQWAERKDGVVIVVSAEIEPVGILVPTLFLEQAYQVGIRASGFSEAIRELELEVVNAGKGPLVRRIRAGYAHGRPIDDFYCARCEQYVDANPCNKHG